MTETKKRTLKFGDPIEVLEKIYYNLLEIAVKKREPKDKVEFKLVDLKDGSDWPVKFSLSLNGEEASGDKYTHREAQALADRLGIEIEIEKE